jgi:hypothetical protein
MKKELNPAVVIGIAALAVIVLVVFGYRAMQPAPYKPSPGAPGSAADDPWLKTHPGQPTQTTTATTKDGKPYYPSAAPGSIPGRPANSEH